MPSVNQQLPKEISPNSTKLSHIILSLICPGIIFTLINLGANYYLKYFPQNSGYWVIQQKWSMLLNLKQPVDWLILGDSSCNQGVIPEVLETELSGESVNLCTIGDSLVLNDAWMLSKYIKKYGAPKNIVIVHVYDIWDRHINWNVTSQIPLDWGYWYQLEPSLDLSIEEQKTIFLNKYVPLYSQDTSLKEILKNQETWFESKGYKVSKDGFMAEEDSNSFNVEQDKKGHLKFVKKNPEFSLSEINKKSLQTIVQLAEKHDINIYLANSPIYQELYLESSFQLYYNQVQKQLKIISDRSKNFYYIMQEPMTFSKEEMENVDHLTVKAAKTYTKQLAKEIKQQRVISKD